MTLYYSFFCLSAVILFTVCVSRACSACKGLGSVDVVTAGHSWMCIPVISASFPPSLNTHQCFYSAAVNGPDSANISAPYQTQRQRIFPLRPVYKTQSCFFFSFSGFWRESQAYWNHPMRPVWRSVWFGGLSILVEVWHLVGVTQLNLQFPSDTSKQKHTSYQQTHYQYIYCTHTHCFMMFWMLVRNEYSMIITIHRDKEIKATLGFAFFAFVLQFGYNGLDIKLFDTNVNFFSGCSGIWACCQ